jgi:hypothetical protein
MKQSTSYSARTLSKPHFITLYKTVTINYLNGGVSSTLGGRTKMHTQFQYNKIKWRDQFGDINKGKLKVKLSLRFN